jgi:hypothetical protein
LFYGEGRDAIPSSTGPFKSFKELFISLIQKEKKFFEIHGVHELVTTDGIDQTMAETKVKKLLDLMDLLQSNLSKLFNELVDGNPFALIHGDFDSQNILVKRSLTNDDVKIVAIIDWEFSRTGTLWEFCQYPNWIKIYDPFEFLSDEELQNQELRDYFYDEMVSKLGNKCGEILEMRKRDMRIEELEEMFSTFMIRDFYTLNILLIRYVYRYGPELQDIQFFDDPIIRCCWGTGKVRSVKIKIPPKETINYLLSKNKLSNECSPFIYDITLYWELKTKGYNFSWQQICNIASHMWQNEPSEFKQECKHHELS